MIEGGGAQVASAGQGGPPSQGHRHQVHQVQDQVDQVDRCAPGEGGSTGQGRKAHVAQGHHMQPSVSLSLRGLEDGSDRC